MFVIIYNVIQTYYYSRLKCTTILCHVWWCIYFPLSSIHVWHACILRGNGPAKWEWGVFKKKSWRLLLARPSVICSYTSTSCMLRVLTTQLSYTFMFYRFSQVYEMMKQFCSSLVYKQKYCALFRRCTYLVEKGMLTGLITMGSL